MDGVSLAWLLTFRAAGTAGSRGEAMGGQESEYTCRSYRREMILLGLRMRMQDPGLSEEERRLVRMELERLEREMEMD